MVQFLILVYQNSSIQYTQMFPRLGISLSNYHIMKIENEIRLDFSDVLITPKRSSLSSRKDVSLKRLFKFKHSQSEWTGIPIIAANMDTTGTLDMFNSLSSLKMMTALHKHYDINTLIQHYMRDTDPDKIAQTIAIHNSEIDDNQSGKGYMVGSDESCDCDCDDGNNVCSCTRQHSKVYVDYNLRQLVDTTASRYSFYSMGITQKDFDKFNTIFDQLTYLCHNLIVPYSEKDDSRFYAHPIRQVCVDVANGYTETFVKFIRELRKKYPHLVIMAGNVVTPNMAEELIIAGADIVKAGVGPGSVCLTRKMAGVGYPQLSAVIECADAVHGVGGLLCSDGGCTNPGDVAKAFGAGADYVMLGGMLAGTDEASGTKTTHLDGTITKQYYGMSSDTAMNKYSGGVASYKASEGKTVEIPYTGSAIDVAQEILGGVRSTCTYVGASKLKELSKRTTFIRVNNQINNIWGKS
jgi:GMP reductase